MMDNQIDSGENNTEITPGTLSYMGQRFVPYAKLNTKLNLDPDTEQELELVQELELELDSEAIVDENQYSDFDLDLDSDQSLDLFINKLANRELDNDDSDDILSDIGDVKDSDDDEQEAADGENKTRMELYDWLQCIVSAIICGIFIFVFIGRTIGVDGSSMMDTLHNNDRVIMSNLFYTPKQGDIIVFQTSADHFGGTPLVKRVIAVAGQTVRIDFQSGDVFVDEILQDEPYIFEPTHTRLNFSGQETVPDGCVFVMGDNRNHSSDSRDSRVGMVDTRYILGRVLIVAIPGSDEMNPRDWSRLGATH